MAESTRDRILGTTAELFRRQGYNGTGLKEIVAAARAPFGSVYHHFPGGKQELAAEVIRSSGTAYGLLLPAVMASQPDLVSGVREFFRLAGQHLEESGWEDACPIATVALEVASVNEPLRQAVQDVFHNWVDGGTRLLHDRGLDATTARRLTIGMIAALEGAFILARAGRTVEPLHAAGELVAAEVARAVAGVNPRQSTPGRAAGGAA